MSELIKLHYYQKEKKTNVNLVHGLVNLVNVEEMFVYVLLLENHWFNFYFIF